MQSASDHNGEWVNLLDCRSPLEYMAGHIRGAANFPVDELFQRLHELPSNDHVLSLCGDAASLTAAAEFLHQKSYRISAMIELDQSAAETFVDLWVSGAENPRLWQASPLLSRFPSLAELWGITPGKAVDLACGAGRDAVWLAMHGWQVTAVDYLPQALQKTQDLAARFNCVVDTKQLDIEQQTLAFNETFDAVVVVRYLHRPLLAQLDGLLNAGGLIIYQTFMQGAAKFGSPKNPNRLLREGELRNVFSGYNILLDEVEYLPDGRPVSAFIAQKPYIEK